MEIEERVQALREELRSGRINQTGESTVRHGESADGQTRPGVQTARRNDNKASSNGRTATGNQRGIEEKSQRVRQSSRRSSNNGSSAPDGNQSSEGDIRQLAGSAIERLDDVPERMIDNELPLPPEKPIGRYRDDYAQTRRNGQQVFYLLADRSQTISREEYKSLKWAKDANKEQASNPISDGLKKVTGLLPGSKGAVLSNQEAKELLDPLAAALVDYGSYLDKLLQMKAHDPLMPDIWGDLTEMEATVLARLMIRRGQKNAAAAEVVRTMVHGDDYIQAAIIVVPRVMRTVETVRRSKPKIVRMQ